MSSLFALEVYLHTFKAYETSSHFKHCNVAFQLSSFEPLVFDHSLQIPDRSSKYSYQIGKSCLFELQLDNISATLFSTPLGVALMSKQTKLLAFTCIDLEKFCSTHGNDVDYQAVRELGCHSDTWKLYSNDGRQVGDIHCTITLSCLGQTLAPHLRQALGDCFDTTSSTDVSERPTPTILPQSISTATSPIKSKPIAQTCDAGTQWEDPYVSLRLQRLEGDTVVENDVCQPDVPRFLAERNENPPALMFQNFSDPYIKPAQPLEPRICIKKQRKKPKQRRSSAHVGSPDRATKTRKETTNQDR